MVKTLFEKALPGMHTYNGIPGGSFVSLVISFTAGPAWRAPFICHLSACLRYLVSPW